MKITPKLVIILSLLIIFASIPHVVNALSFTSPFDGATTVECDTNGKDSITVKVVSCVKTLVMEYTRAFLSFMTDAMEPVIWGMITFCIVLTAMRVMLLERNPQKIIMGAIFKIFIVILVANNFGANSGMFDQNGLQGATFSLMEGMQIIVVENMYEDTDTCKLSDHQGKTSDFISADSYKPFAYMDCILEYIMGFNTAAGIGASLLGFTSSALFGGTMGATVFFFGVATLLAITFFVLRVVFTVLMCYVFAGLLIAIIPLFAWTLMFRFTEQMFVKYLYNIIAAIFMPFMMVSFMAFAIPMLDSYVLDETNERSLVKVLGAAKDAVGGLAASPTGGSKITDHYRLESPLCSMSFPTDPLFAKGLDQSKIREDDSNPLQTGSVDWCAGLKVNSVDLGPDHNNKLWKIAQSLLQILFIVWIITSVGNWIPMLTASLIGEGRALADRIMNGMALENAAQNAFGAQAGLARSGTKQIGAGADIGSIFK